MIEFKDASFSYGDRKVLKNFSLEIKDGERVCLYGASGTGKTTLIRLALGLERATDGEVINSAKSVSAVFQEDRLLPFKTVKGNIDLFCKSSRADYLLSSLGIAEASDKYPSMLSGGMKHRAAIARALAKEADLYIFDEPFAGLDEENIKKAIRLINEITSGKTVLAVTHELKYARELNCKIINIP